MTNSLSMPWSIVRDQGKAPCIIRYSEDQMTNLKTLCCSGQRILRVDKTFNLCDMHVTATCYTQIRVLKDMTNEPPIFLGSVFIHDNSDFDSYSKFFNHLRTKLVNIDNTRLTIGSDEGNALLNAITIAFPEENHLLCKRHLIYQNTKQKLVDDSIDKPDRRKMLDLIFSDDVLINADDSICF